MFVTDIYCFISLDNNANWLKANKLTLNVKKSNLLVFDSRKNSMEKPPVKLFINDEELEQKGFAKYLGVYFDKQLSWSKHTEITNNKLHKGIGISTKLCKHVQEETIKNLFNSFLKPYTEYGNLGWGGAPKTKIELINRSIKRSIRTMMDMDKFDSVKPFYEYLKILPFKDNMKLLQGKFMQKLVNAVHPNSISEKSSLTYSEAINNHQNKLVIPYCHRAISKRSLAYAAQKPWNQEVPVDIKSVKTIKAINKAYRKHLSNT